MSFHSWPCWERGKKTPRKRAKDCVSDKHSDDNFIEKQSELHATET